MTTHTQLLNYLATKYNLKRYCEVGVQRRAQNFDKIRVPFKIGVDPMVKEPLIYETTSDIYFDSIIGDAKFDLFFLDGLHEKEQIRRDFENALKHLSENGFIVCHDVLPENESTTHVPRDSKQWHGNVFSWAMRLYTCHNVDFVTLNIDNGCMVIWKSNRFSGPPFTIVGTTDWDFYIDNRKVYMNIISPSEIEKYLP